MLYVCTLDRDYCPTLAPMDGCVDRALGGMHMSRGMCTAAVHLVCTCAWYGCCVRPVRRCVCLCVSVSPVVRPSRAVVRAFVALVSLLRFSLCLPRFLYLSPVSLEASLITPSASIVLQCAVGRPIQWHIALDRRAPQSFFFWYNVIYVTYYHNVRTSHIVMCRIF